MRENRVRDSRTRFVHEIRRQDPSARSARNIYQRDRSTRPVGEIREQDPYGIREQDSYCIREQDP